MATRRRISANIRRTFFDFIVIDECHRGGANDESNWRGILEYFSPAVQLGLTATPRRKVNADTFTWQSVNRTIDDQPLDDLPPVKVTRIKPAQ